MYDVKAILISIQSLLTDPNPASPANAEAARLFSSNRREYDRKVREFVEKTCLLSFLSFFSQLFFVFSLFFFVFFLVRY
jgi:hypothetical protein